MSYIFDIKRYSINDGPGIRITIFLKGCPLSCIWCHNPEGMKPTQSKLYTATRCIGCGLCIKACKNGALSIGTLANGKRGIITDFSKCQLCGECAKACPAKAMEMAGKEYSVEELMTEIRKESVFFEESGGGVTICGGEPLMHKEVLIPLLDACGKEGFHRCIDTTLFAQRSLIEEVALKCELFLVDLKLMDSQRHKQFTGVDNSIILSNISFLASIGKPFIIRIPLIKGVNADIANLTASAIFLSNLQEKYISNSERSRIRVELLPYHDIAKGKHARLGTIYNPLNIVMKEPTDSEITKAKKIFIKMGLEVGE
ncbi:MAG: glycyl-radical enzyme activating protein [Bacteroidales bacterium]